MSDQATPTIVPADAALLREIAEELCHDVPSREHCPDCDRLYGWYARLYALADATEKITREEVETVRHEAQRIASEWEPDEPAYRDAVVLFALAAKLAALLPTE